MRLKTRLNHYQHWHIPGFMAQEDPFYKSPETPSDHLRSLPPIYRSIDGDLYFAERAPLETKSEAVRGAEFQFVDQSVFELNLSFRIKKEIEESDLIFEHRKFLLELMDAILTKDESKLTMFIMSIEADLDPESWEFLNFRGYRGLHLLHLSVLYLEDAALRNVLIACLLSAGVFDGHDDLGATAHMRAHQLGYAYPSDEQLSFYHGFELATSSQEFRPILSAESCFNEISREDLSETDCLCEKELLFYFYLFLPKGFSAKSFNQKWVQQFESSFPITIRWEQGFLDTVVAPHFHTHLGKEQYGLFVKEAIELGRIVTFVTGQLCFSIKKDVNDAPEDFTEFSSNHAYYSLPLSEVQLSYDGSLLCPYINFFPEKGPYSSMFINDSGNPLTTNVTWIHLFVNGLPALMYISIQPILKGHEILTDYIQKNPNWAKNRDIVSKEIEVIPHPYLL